MHAALAGLNCPNACRPCDVQSPPPPPPLLAPRPQVPFYLFYQLTATLEATAPITQTAFTLATRSLVTFAPVDGIYMGRVLPHALRSEYEAAVGASINRTGFTLTASNGIVAPIKSRYLAVEAATTPSLRPHSAFLGMDLTQFTPYAARLIEEVEESRARGNNAVVLPHVPHDGALCIARSVQAPAAPMDPGRCPNATTAEQYNASRIAWPTPSSFDVAPPGVIPQAGALPNGTISHILVGLIARRSIIGFVNAALEGRTAMPGERGGRGGVGGGGWLTCTHTRVTRLLHLQAVAPRTASCADT
jgi:hypothetical protein